MIFARETDYKGEKCVELRYNDYYAVVAPSLGCNVIRLRNDALKIDVFRYDDGDTLETYYNNHETYGFPTLYLPNRLEDGVLKTSDGEYHFPVNEAPPYNNYIHGFLHKRKFTVTKLEQQSDCVLVKLEYTYDENDEMFKYFPVSFRTQFVYSLSDAGLEQYVTMFNLSLKKLPIGLGSHTSVKAPFVDGGNPDNIRLFAPIGEKILLDSRCLTTGETKALEDYDKQYLLSKINPATLSIDNDMYFAVEGEYDGKPFQGIIAEDTESGKKICYETGHEYAFWIFWNEWGNKGYFCPEPMTWMINAPNMDLPKEITGYREISPKQQFTAYQRIFTA